MKKFRKIMAVLVAAMMIMATMVPAWANPTKATVTIKYNPGTGNGTATTETVEVPANSDHILFALPQTTTFTKTGAEFLGWSLTNSDSGIRVDRILVKDTQDTQTIDLYAMWGAKPATTASSPSTGTITISHSVPGETYTAYQLFELISWTDTDIRPDQHEYDKEAYSYYIVEGSPLYDDLKDYEFATGKTAFIFDVTNKIQESRSGSNVNLVPVRINPEFAASLTTNDTEPTGYDENEKSEYQGNKAVQKFAQAMMTKIQDMDATNKAKLAKGTATGASDGAAVNISPAVPYGYYLVDSTLGSLCALDTTNPNATVVDKNEFSTVAKQVKEDGTGEFGDRNDADFGQTVEFKSVVTIPMRESTVVFHDTMNETSFEFDPSSIVVEGWTAGKYTVYSKTAGTYGSVTTTTLPSTSLYTGDTFAIAFDTLESEGKTGSTTVTITYSAKLTKSAIVGKQEGDTYATVGSGNDNKTTVTFGGAQRTEVDWTRTYTWSYDILKYTKLHTPEYKAKTTTTNGETTDTFKDEAEAAKAHYIKSGLMNGAVVDNDKYWVKINPLSGAEFKVEQGATQLKFTKKSDGNATDPVVYQYDANGGVSLLTTPASGLITIEGLDATTYVITETTAPVGYNKLSAPVNIEIDSTTDTTLDTNGGQRTIDMTLKNGGTAVAQIEIENFTSTELPSTGGMGTTVLYIVGGMLVILAGAYLFFSRKKTA